MAKKIDYIEASKTGWHATVKDDESNFPGVDYMKMACLQRIATATEAMAKNHFHLQNELDRYKGYYNYQIGEVNRLTRSNAALRGIVNRMKKEAKNG